MLYIVVSYSPVAYGLKREEKKNKDILYSSTFFLCTVLVHLLHVKYCTDIHYLPCNIWDDVTFRSGNQEK